MPKENLINFSTQSVPQLKELLERQNALLHNKKLLGLLKDKGESVKKLHIRIQDEIELQLNIESLQKSLSVLTLTSNDSNNDFLSDKHVEYVCSKDKPIHDTRYRPHRTLLHHQEPKTSPNKAVELTAASEPKLRNETVKFVSLAESLVIQNDQAIKVVEERARRTLGNLQFFAANDGESSEDDDNSGTNVNVPLKEEESDDGD